MRRRSWIAGLLLLVAACSNGTPQADPSPSPTTAAPASAPTPTCAVTATKHFVWPLTVPNNLPQPPGSTLIGSTRTTDGLTVVRLASPDSLQQSVLYIIRAIQDAGYTLGRGDAEPAEADAPFGNQNVRGLYKMVVRGACSTEWLIAVTTPSFAGSGPLLPRTTTASPSPLPFS